MHLRLVVPLAVARPTGGNVYDLALADALLAQGDVVDVVTSSPLDLALRTPGPGLVLIDGLLASDRPDVVRASGAGVLVHMPLAWRDPSLAQFEAEALRAARVVIATSQWTADFLLAAYAVEAVVVPPGVDPAPLEVGSDPPLIVQLAALAPHKDQLTVVHALAAVRDLQWRARLVGSHDADPEYAAEVVGLVDELGLAHRIEIPGELARDAAFAGANLLLLPSRVEAYGMVVTEALARGIPAIVTPGGPAEALGQTSPGEVPGIVLGPLVEESSLVEEDEERARLETKRRPLVEEGEERARLETTLRDWLTDPELQAELRRRALVRRTELSGWDSAATRFRDLESRAP